MCPKELAEKYGHFELAEDLQDFEENKRMHTKTIPSSPMEVNNNYDRDDEQNYMEMSPGIEYMKMSPPGNQDNEKTMTSEIWRAIHIAEQAVNQSWRNSDISEQTAKAFSQLIQRSAREHKEELIYDAPRKEVNRAPALPPKNYRLNNKRHSIHDIPTCGNGPPLPPRSPRSPRSPISPGFFRGERGIDERRGSEPSAYIKMQPQFDQQPICEETTAGPPVLPKPKAIRGLANGCKGSDAKLSNRPSNNNFGSCNGTRNSLTLPVKPHQGMNGLPRHPDFPNVYLRPKSHSVDATSMGLSPKLPPRSPRNYRNRSLSFEPGVPEEPNHVKSRTLSETR